MERTNVHAAPARLPNHDGVLVSFMLIIDGIVGTSFALLRLARWFLTFASLTVPSAVYKVLHYTLTLRLSFAFLIVVLISVSAILLAWLRYRHWNRYEKFRDEPIRKNENAYHLHPDVAHNAVGEDRGNFHWYLDEFLQAIRIFGFLERPVFHELARHLQTRRLVAGDVLSLDSDYSFYIVVDGNVQVFAPSGKPSACPPGSEPQDAYQLVNEVERGGTLSSLFTILRLFTENVQLRFTQDTPDITHDAHSQSAPPHLSPSSVLNNAASHHAQDARPDTFEHSTLDLSESMAAVSPLLGPMSPSLSSFGAPSCSATASQQPPLADMAPGSMARATVDTTVAVIPAEAFRRLTAKFPSAASHIVQVILTRLSRVTFHTAHRYLGLTREVMQTEKAINEYAKVFLPSIFYEQGAIEQLRRRFRSNPSSGWANTPVSPLDRDAPWLNSPPATMPRSRVVSHAASATLHAQENGDDALPQLHTAVGPGDLHSMISTLEEPAFFEHSSRHPSIALRSDMREASSRARPDDITAWANNVPLDLREEVMNCIASSIGLTQAVIQEAPSTNASPYLSGQDALHRNVYTGLSGLGMSTASEDSTSATSRADFSSANIDGAQNGVEIRFFHAGEYLVHADEQNAGLFYVIDGFLDLSLQQTNVDDVPEKQKSKHEKTSREADLEEMHDSRFYVPPPSQVGNALDGTAEETKKKRAHSDMTGQAREQRSAQFLFSIGRGGIAGYLSSLLGVPSYADIVAKTDVYVGYLPVKALECLVEKRTNALLTLSKRLLSLLPPLILHIDAALDWQQVDAGQVIYREGDVSDSIYIVINGRLRAITDHGKDGELEILGEYGQGDSVGELDMITNSRRAKTVHSIRDSELARMPITLFNAISVWHPPITIQVSRLIARRMRRELGPKKGRLNDLPTHVAGVSSLGRSTLNLKTVALLPSSFQVPIVEFARRLQATFKEMRGSTIFLNRHTIMRALGRHAFSRMGKLKLAGWLAHQEQMHRLVVYVIDTSVGSSWAQTSIRQADCILLVGFGDDPRVGEFERLLLSVKTTARKELVLLHAERSVLHGSTREWLRTRPWISAHHHVEMAGLDVPQTAAPTLPPDDPRPVRALRSLKERLETRIGRGKTRSRVATIRPVHFNDFARLARRLCGTSIGLVLGGGGARGCAHVGVLRAMEEYGIPIDMVGGTSIGSLVGGLYARDGDAVSSHGRTKRFAGRMASLWRFVTDLTYPLVSYTTGHEFNRGIFKCFADTHIEDMWLPFFCNTTNITWSRMEVHTSGYAWRYIRGSMTLAGIVPPLIDDGHMLVDGGYTDNLPVGVMMALGARTVFAVDVSSIDDTSPQHYGDTLSGWWVLLSRFNPWSKMWKVPGIPDIQSRLTYTTSVRMLEDAKSMDNCLYLRMPVEQYGTLEFSKYEELLQAGYVSTHAALRKWDEEHRLPSDADNVDAKTTDDKDSGGVRARRNSF
ncbi:hypothetical protein MVES1_003641 [Malassezia vespertilionis]|uniref:Lysophospholipase NTE1 n=1 Tax=Malassezia vespertilionis TaxID=2020962 RepID=A0A2N1J8K6_9BASI|nr:uncharacterized protein MVES1_003641 [Malassezia vespertilionis]PKI82893.1 Nte1p [Malassezia vespertilionis]WFD08269.1 hypothetical protein MVES1_003641 [Malassezia vespertilionis]